MIIRSVTIGDFEQWLSLWDGYNSHYERTLPLEITKTTWARFLDPHEPIHALVAEETGELRGLVHYLYHRSSSI